LLRGPRTLEFQGQSGTRLSPSKTLTRRAKFSPRFSFVASKASGFVTTMKATGLVTLTSSEYISYASRDRLSGKVSISCGLWSRRHEGIIDGINMLANLGLPEGEADHNFSQEWSRDVIHGSVHLAFLTASENTNRQAGSGWIAPPPNHVVKRSDGGLQRRAPEMCQNAASCAGSCAVVHSDPAILAIVFRQIKPYSFWLGC
jgi:hypothetical protein